MIIVVRSGGQVVMQVRLPLAILALVAAFGGGVASSRLIEGEARAQAAPQQASVYLPAEGLAFRSADGHIVARLSYDARGGAFEVYDGHERPAAALRSGLVTEAPRSSSTLPAATVATVATPDIDLGY
jgi:hypothetical protein